MRLKDGSRIAVVGGGPAGSFFALYLLQFGGLAGLHLDITIFQQRHFEQCGPKGCKGCAGIVSASLLRNLSDLHLTIPDAVVQSRIEHYTVHSPYTSISISNPDRSMPIVSVYRGGGPLHHEFDHPVSFDAWLLGEANRRGARIQHDPVKRVMLGKTPRIQVGEAELDLDLVVMAAGVNAGPLQIEGLDYVPPQTTAMAQDELYAGAAEVEALLGGGAHAFLIPRSGLVFGTLVPKGPFINVSIMSRGKRRVSVSDFLNYDVVRRVLPTRYERACGCRPRAVVAPASNYYADGFVTIGDAVVSRLYKDGMGSSLLTARQAAHTAIHYGTSRDEFHRHYQPLCHSIEVDNSWGKKLFAINDFAKDSRIFMLAQHRLIGDEQISGRGPQPFTKAVWGMFTGGYSYRSIMGMTFNPVSVARLFAACVAEGTKNLMQRRMTHPPQLFVGKKKVLILGSGFSGTYVLRNLVPSLNKNENVETTMVNEENFFLFLPLLHEVATGRIDPRHIAYPIRRLHWRDRFSFLQAKVERIDLDARKVFTSSGILDYDYLVLALGSVTDTSALGDSSDNIFTLKTLRDSVRIRNHLIEVFEKASAVTDPVLRQHLLTFVVAGAGYTGVQLVTELSDFLCKHLCRYYRSIQPSDIRILLVESGRKIVAELHTKLGAYTMKLLKEMGIEVRLESRISRSWDYRIEINGAEQIGAATVLWTAGVVASPRIAELKAQKDGDGRVYVDEYLQVPGYPGVYSLGDCAHFKDPETGGPIPPRAHIAVRQAKVVARNILADLRGRDKSPFHYSNTAEIVSLGSSRAVMRFHGIRAYGYPARLLWLVSYTLLVTGSYNRTRIIMDWVLSTIFGRDTTQTNLK